MSLAHWIVVGMMTFEALYTVHRVGRPREPLSNKEAVVQVIQWGIMAALVVLG